MIENTIDEEREDAEDDTIEESASEQLNEIEEASDGTQEEEAAEESEDHNEQASGTRIVLMRSGEETDIVFCFTTPATIGRFDPSVGPIDIDLGTIEEASYVSRKHAQIVEGEGTYKLIDMGSSNGTFVLRDDFEKIDEAEITDGDEIAFGNARFVFRV